MSPREKESLRSHGGKKKRGRKEGREGVRVPVDKEILCLFSRGIRRASRTGRPWCARNLTSIRRKIEPDRVVALDLSHFLQQIEVFLEYDRSGMGIAESLLGTTYGFSVEKLSFTQFSLSFE